MADITPTEARLFDDNYTVTWETLTSSNTAGASWDPKKTEASIATAQFTGTFDSATAVLQGSNDGTNWVTLKDMGASNVSFTSAGYAEISTAFAYIRPSTSGGGGSQDIDCILVARG